MKRLVWFSLLVFSFFSGAAAGRAAAPALSDRMTLDEIERALAAWPPAPEFAAQRAAIAASLDKQVTVQIRKGWTAAERASLRPLHAFYLRRVDRGLDALERTSVTAGVRAFKFYSSSFVFKTARGTVAVDFCQGPINNGGEPETRDEYGSGFYCTPAQRDRLARLVDVFLITHRHHDHADYSLAHRLVAAGKTVIGPAQLKTQWPELAAGITVPNYGTAQRFGPVEIYTTLGAQCARNEPAPGGGPERVGVPSPKNVASGGSDLPTSDSETIGYLFKLNGIVFLQAAENHIPAADWLRRGARIGFQPDVRLSLGQFQGERALGEVLATLPPLFRLPLHEYELMHEGGGNRTGPLFQGNARKAIERGESMPLFWGEDYLIASRQ